MKISIAADHAGFDLKNFLVEELRDKGFEVHDHGAHELIPEDDYPQYISKVAQDISSYEEARINGDYPTHSVHGEPYDTEGRDIVGIIVGGSGQGEAMVANKFPHVRAAVLYGGIHVGGSSHLIETITKLSREHNDANVLSLGARFLDKEESLAMVLLWLETSFSGDQRHERRLREIEDIEKDN